MKDFPLVNNLKLIGYCFYTSRTCVAIVLCIDTITNEKKSYIGSIVGEDMSDDLIQTISWGCRFNPEIAETLINQTGTFI